MSKKPKKIEKKSFLFLRQWYLIWCVKFSVLSRYCLSSAVYMLKNSLRILCITKTYFFKSTYFKVFNKYCKGAAIKIAKVLQPICHVVCLKVL